MIPNDHRCSGLAAGGNQFVILLSRPDRDGVRPAEMMAFRPGSFAPALDWFGASMTSFRNGTGGFGGLESGELAFERLGIL